MIKNRDYIIDVIDEKRYVVLLGEERIDLYFSSISLELSKENYSGVVLFDLLKSNGESRRYFSSFFKDCKFIFRSFKLEKSINSELKCISDKIFDNNIYRGLTKYE